MFRHYILAAATLVGAGACASGTKVTAGGDVASVTPANRDFLPVGTTMNVRLDQQISTSNREGDTFSATIVDPVYAQDNTIAVPAGSTLFGHVTGVHRASLPTEQNIIRLNFDELRLRGHAYPFNGTISNVTVRNQGSNNAVRNAVAGGAAGAVIGAVLSGGELSSAITGGLIGAGAGAAISMGIGNSSDAVIPAGSNVTVRSTQPVQVR